MHVPWQKEKKSAGVRKERIDRVIAMKILCAQGDSDAANFQVRRFALGQMVNILPTAQCGIYKGLHDIFVRSPRRPIDQKGKLMLSWNCYTL